MPDISGELGTGSVGTPTHGRAVGLSGWFGSSLTYALTGNAGAGGIGALIPGVSNEIWAASPGLADILSAIAIASPGDTVNVPAGAATWDSTLAITKKIAVIGAGYLNTAITVSHADAVVTFVPSDTESTALFRYSGFGFSCPNGNAQFGMYASVNTAQWIRVDHNRSTGSVSFWQNMVGPSRGGVFYGVIDNNVWVSGAMGSNTYIGTTAQGMWNWRNRTFDLGTADNLYWEDNDFTCRSFLGSCGLGMRYCARYNTVTLNSAIFQAVFDCHGNQDSSGHTAGMGFEVYHNTLNAGGAYTQFLEHRGGRCACYYNVVNNAANLDMNCREEYRDDLRPENVPFATMSAPDIYAERGQPMHPSGSYNFENRRNTDALIPVNFNGSVDYTSFDDSVKCFTGEGVVPTEDRHIWQQKVGFDGSSGVGVGPLSSRPVSCTGNGVAWWATDESRLYRWRTGVGWELFYTPYPYPHPLRGE